MAHFIPVVKRILFTSIIAGLWSCGQPAVQKHLTDEFYLIATDQVEELSLSYHCSGASYTNIVTEKILAVGYNENFIIVQQQPADRDTLLYYIIAINEIKKEREKFVSKTDTIRYRSNHKDIHGKDSLGPEEIQTLTTEFSPQKPEPLTFKRFMSQRKRLHLPDTLNFTIQYEDLSTKKSSK